MTCRIAGTLVLSGALALALATHDATAQDPVSCFALPDTLAPSTPAFVREVLDASPTTRTPRFDDYTRGSYHVIKSSLPDSLSAAARRCHIALRTAVIVGPVGPLWTYHVVVVLGDTGSLRLNSLIMPHARITGKGTKQFTRAALDGALGRLQHTGVLHNGLPACTRYADSVLGCDFSYQLLVTKWIAGSRTDSYAVLDHMRPSAPVDSIVAIINSLLSGVTETYPHGQRQ